jgi:hypothetical protein
VTVHYKELSCQYNLTTQIEPVPHKRGNKANIICSDIIF